MTHRECCWRRGSTARIWPEAHGGPCRLVSVGQACYASVKWVDSITVTDAAPEETAREIAMARNAGG